MKSIGRYRIMNWIDLRTMKKFYGIQIRVEPRKYLSLCNDGKPMFFDLEYDACAAMLVVAEFNESEDGA